MKRFIRSPLIPVAPLVLAGLGIAGCQSSADSSRSSGAAARPDALDTALPGPNTGSASGVGTSGSGAGAGSVGPGSNPGASGTYRNGLTGANR